MLWEIMLWIFIIFGYYGNINGQETFNYSYKINSTNNTHCETNPDQHWNFITFKNEFATDEQTIINNIKDQVPVINNTKIYIINRTDIYTIFLVGKFLNGGKCVPSQLSIMKNLIPKIYHACNSTTKGYTEYSFTSNSVSVICQLYNPTELPPLFCFNQGIANNDGFRKCNCSTISNGVTVGPQCQISEQSLSDQLPSKQVHEYLYTLGKSDKIIIEFEIYSGSIKKNPTLFLFYKHDVMINYTINESENIINSSTHGEVSISYDIIMKWSNFKLEINEKELVFYLNSLSKTISFNGNNRYLNNFQQYILNIYQVPPESNACIRNFKINGRIIGIKRSSTGDCCADRCKLCDKKTTICNCKPFVTNDRTTCECKSNLTISTPSKTPSTCPVEKERIVQLASKETVNIPQSLDKVNNISIKIRTVIENGTILDMKPTPIKVLLLKGRLNLMFTDHNKKNINQQLDFYNVADGRVHSVKLEIKNRDVSLSLDDNLPSGSISIDTGVIIDVTNVTLGPLDSVEGQNQTICISNIQINKAEPTLNTAIQDICKSVVNCFPSCKENEECKGISFGKSKCQCKPQYVVKNNSSECIPQICQVKPCLNEGECVPDGSLRTRTCKCKSGFYGDNCDNVISSAVIWWIPVLIILILLLILIIILLIYFCCCRKKTSKKPIYPPIGSINEDAVKYNERAGEEDYKGPPINFAVINNALKNNKMPKTSKTNNLPPPSSKSGGQLPPAHLMNLKNKHDSNNNDLVLDHPLEYGYEGDDDVHSLGASSFGSSSTDADLDRGPLDHLSKNKNISTIYKQ